MKKSKLFLTNGIILTLTALFMRTIGISFNVYISNRIGAEGMGIFSLVMSIYAFAITLATSGISIATTRIVTEELSVNNKEGAKKVVRKSIFFSFIISIIAGIIIIILSDFLVTNCLHSKVSSKSLYCIIIGLPFISMSASINGYFSAVRKVAKTASSQILEQTVKIIVTVYILNLLLPKGLEYACISLIIGDVISEVVSFTYILILYIIETRKMIISKRLSESYTKRILAISIPIAFTSYIRSGLSTLKQMLIPMQLEKSGISCELALSQYGIITGMVLPIILFPNVIITSFSNLIIPEFSYYYADRNYTRINQICTRLFKICLIFSIGIFGILLTFSDKLSMIMYGNLETSYYIKLLSPLIILMYLDTIVDGMLKGLNEQVSVMKCNILDLVTSISFIFFLLPVLGINGYIIVLYISEILNTVISIFQLLKITKSKIKYIYWVIIPLSGAFFARYALNFLDITSTRISTLIFQFALYIIFYTIFLFFTSCINKKDFKL